jgi:ketosteroid isomerase-like protein
MLNKAGRDGANAIRNLAICCCFVTWFASAQNPKSDLSTEGAAVMALERAWIQASLSHDAHAIGSMIGERFINTDSAGVVSGRRKFLADALDPKVQISASNIEFMKADTYPGAAVVTGTYRAKGTNSGRPYDYLWRFTDTWVYEDGKWLCVASHSSLMKK